MAIESTFPPYRKFSIDELMQLVDLFKVSIEGQRAFRDVLVGEKTPPQSKLFRYYNADSKVAVLEKRFAEHLQAKHALGVNSGTSALIAALVAAGVAPGDEVIVPAYTFFASTSAIVVARGVPVITEIDESLGLDPAAVEANITPRTKAILVVHMNGYPAKMDAICAIAEKHGLAVIEDVAQASGGTYKGKHLGTWGDLGCFSFDAFKVMATGEGGMVITDDQWLYTRAQSYHDTAACWRPDRYAKERKEGELFCGENYRMSEMSGAIGLSQLEKLDWVNENTRRVFRTLQQKVELPKGVRWLPSADPDGVCGYRVAMLFDSVELAQKVIQAKIGIGGMAGGGMDGARDWHVYWYWEHVLEQKTITPEGCPFKCPHVDKLPEYSKDMCPNTRDIVMRMGMLGTVPTMTDRYVDELAEQLSEDLARVVS